MDQVNMKRQLSWKCSSVKAKNKHNLCSYWMNDEYNKLKLHQAFMINFTGSWTSADTCSANSIRPRSVLSGDDNDPVKTEIKVFSIWSLSILTNVCVRTALSLWPTQRPFHIYHSQMADLRLLCASLPNTNSTGFPLWPAWLALFSEEANYFTGWNKTNIKNKFEMPYRFRTTSLWINEIRALRFKLCSHNKHVYRSSKASASFYSLQK